MSKFSDWFWAVVEVDIITGAVRKDVSHVAFKTVTEANDYVSRNQQVANENGETLIVLCLRKG